MTGEATAPATLRFGNVAETLSERAALEPDRVALVCGERRQTYRELDREVDTVARVLLGLGVRPGDKVAYLLENRAELLHVYYAVQRIGAVAVPINARAIARELAYLVGASDADVLVFSERGTEVVAEARDRLARVRALLCVDAPTPWCPSLAELAAAVGDEPVPVHRDPDAPSRIQFTGGSTGTPKGVVRSHRADLVELEGVALSNGLPDDEAKVVLIQCPMEHHGGHSWFTSAIATGATVVVCQQFDPEEILALVERLEVSYMILLPPSTYARLMADPAIARHDLSSVRLVQTSAGGTSARIVADVYRWFPGCRMNYGWGQTESGLGSSLVLTREMAERRLRRVGSIGRPMPFFEMRVVDGEGRPVPDGTVGECQVRSAAVMSGYYRQPELTRAAFTDDGWLRTGDLMSRDADGYYYLKSRKRHLVKSGGENVFVAEVEDVVRAHPAVADCLVYGRPDERLGEAVAVVAELRDGAALTLAELQRHCRAHLASYKKPLHLTVLDGLGRDYSGKLDRPTVLRRAAVADAVAGSARTRPRLDDVCRPAVPDLDVFRVDLPHEETFERSTACYLLRAPAPGRSLLVDAGPDLADDLGLLFRVLDELGVAPDRLDVLATHEHADHTGLAARLPDRSSRVLLSAAAAAHLRAVAGRDHAAAETARWAAEGFGADEAAALAAATRRAMPATPLDRPVVELDDGAPLDVGGRRWRAVATPGHTPGHLCLLQPDAGALLLGDHVLFHVTPPVVAVPGRPGLLGEYLAQLDRVARLGVRVPLPGHGPSGELAARARTLAAHHEERLAQVLADVRRHPGSAGADVMRRTRALEPGSPPPEPMRWLLGGVTLAYLDLLVERGAVRRASTADGLFAYHPDDPED